MHMKTSGFFVMMSLLLIALLFEATASGAPTRAARAGCRANSSSLARHSPRVDSLDDRVKAEIAPFKGKVSLFAKNLDTGETYALHADDRVRTASTIRFAGVVGLLPGFAE